MFLCKMGPMRKLSQQHKIPGRSLPEIVGRFDALVSRQQNHVGRKFGERKVSAEAIANSLVLYFMDLPNADQDAILDRYLPDLGRLLKTEPGQIATEAGSVKHTAELIQPAKSRRRLS